MLCSATPHDSHPLPPLDGPIPDRAGSRRTAHDHTSVLLELARAQRGFHFYPETDLRRRTLAEHAHRAITSELRRAGPIDLSLQRTDGVPTQFRPASEGEPLDAVGPLKDLATTWLRHGLVRLRLDEALTATALTALLDLLARRDETVQARIIGDASGSAPRRTAEAFDSLARALAARDTRGLRLNDLDDPGRPLRPALATTPRHARMTAALDEADEPDLESVTGDPEKPTLSDAPLVAPAHDDVGERMRARLVELDAISDDSDYLERLLDVADWTGELWAEGRRDDTFRALLVLADHAVGGGGRSEVQARTAAATFGSLARGALLEDLIQRATSPGTAGIRAAQLLLQLGEAAVPAILTRLTQETDADRGAPLRALVLTQGDKALGALLDGIRSADDARACLGLRLAGELQNPLVLPALLDALRSPHLARRIEAIRALGLLPGEEAQAALSAALGSDLDEIAIAAARTLCARIGERAAGSLIDVLESAVRDGRTSLACAIVELIGRIGDERAVPRLCALLDRKPLLRRAHWYAIQLVVIDALASLPTREARRCIDRAARHGTQSIRARAQAVLARDERARLDRSAD